MRIACIGLQEFCRFDFDPFEGFQYWPTFNSRVVIVNQTVLSLFVGLAGAELCIAPLLLLLLLHDDVHHPCQTLLSPQDSLAGSVFEEGTVDEAFALC